MSFAHTGDLREQKLKNFPFADNRLIRLFSLTGDSHFAPVLLSSDNYDLILFLSRAFNHHLAPFLVQLLVAVVSPFYLNR